MVLVVDGLILDLYILLYLAHVFSIPAFEIITFRITRYRFGSSSFCSLDTFCVLCLVGCIFSALDALGFFS